VSRVIFLTAFALLAFAFNSILCRLALRGGEADAAGFTTVRLAAGAVTLVLLSFLLRKPAREQERNSQHWMLRPPSWSGFRNLGGSWVSALWLAAYAICFSIAYLEVTAGTGALILFGSVQITMLSISIATGERPPILEWLGIILAIGGLVYLVLPGLAAPPLNSSLLMAVAGASWGFYTLRGKKSSDPLADTTGNFVRTLVVVPILALVFWTSLHLSAQGTLLAILSGAVASGIGYTVWYAALKHHTPTRAAVLQLSVPVIAAVLGIFFLAETANLRLMIAGALVLGGIGLTIVGRRK
jgi:drug/metabolite transporter (DMT)-like permease